MSLNIGILTIYGTNDALMPEDWEHQLSVTKFFGLDGVSVIDGGTGDREITCEVWLYNNYTTPAALATAIQTLDNSIGVSGTLTDSNLAGVSYKNCIFLGFTPTEKALYDSRLGWFRIGRLRFKQTKVS